MRFAILCLPIVLWPVVAMAGGLAFNVLVMVTAPLLAWSFIRSLHIRLYMLALVAFFMFAGASTFWSPRPVAWLDVDFAALRFGVPNDVVRVALLFLGGGVLLAAARKLDEKARRRLQWVAIAALLLQLAIVVGLTLFEREAIAFFYPGRPDHDGVQNISRNCLIMAAAAPFLILGLAEGRRRSIAIALGAIILAIVVAVLVKREVLAGLLALGLSGGALALIRIFPRQGFRVIGSAVALVLLAAPVWSWAASRGADQASSTSTIDYRQIIWERTLDVVVENPVLGGGVGVLRTMRDQIDEGAFADQFVIPNHPHNMMLQVWAETGGVGALLLAAAIVLAAFRLPHPAALGSMAPRIAMLTGAMTAIGCVSFDLWNGWWWALGAILAVMTVARPREVEPSHEAPTRTIVFGEDSSFQSPEIEPVTTSHVGGQIVSHERDPLVAKPEGLRAHNNFHLVRLLLALMVVAYHAVALSGVPSWAESEMPLSIAAELGVQGFFVVSGYLVWISLSASRSVGIYIEKRARRLLPAYIVVVLACAGAALVFSEASRADLEAVGRYVGWNLSFLNFMEPGLPGVFEANRFREINGALWTLKIEVLFYLILPVLAWVLAVARSWRWVWFLLIYVGAEVWRAQFEALGSEQGNQTFVELSRQLPGQMSFFIVGIALACWRDVMSWRSLLVPLAIVLLVASVLVPALDFLRAFGVGVVVIWLAAGLPRLLNAARFGDLSYGLYIVHFPIIQTVIALGVFANDPWIGLSTAVAASLIAALLLWHLVEKPSLRPDSLYRHSRS